MKHVAVYNNADNFAGWPANHGHWQWSDEFLCGFMIGKHDGDGYGNGAGHAINPPYTKMLARSFDGGESWRIEKPNADFECMDPRPAPVFSLLDPDTIIRVCGNYDTGGENCHRKGGFYLSTNRGAMWTGPFAFAPFVLQSTEHNTSRTCVLGNQVFLSIAKRNQWGSDYIIEMTQLKDIFFGTDLVIKDQHRAVMPAVAYLEESGRTVLVCRRKGNGKNWIDVFAKDLWCAGWRQLSTEPITDCGFANGNPPALIAIGGRLYCAYGNRTDKAIRVIESRDGGTTWTLPVTLATSHDRDLGYPRLFKRSDGMLVCVYYISSGQDQPNHIEACIFDPT